MTGSASAGMIGRIFCHPIDTVKARLQANTAAGQTMASHLQLRNFSLQHLRGLYRGLGVSMIGSAPATCLYLTSYEVSKDSLQSIDVFRNSPSLSYLGAGMLAEALSCVLWVPIDVIKERMQVQSKVAAATSGSAGKTAQTLYYRNTVHAIQTIMKTEGLSGMYKGYMATLFSFGPFSALYFMLYEKNKAIAQSYLKVEDLPPLYTLTGAALAGATASFLTNPLDLIKLRLQIQRAYVAEGSTGSMAYSGIFNGLSRVIRRRYDLAHIIIYACTARVRDQQVAAVCVCITFAYGKIIASESLTMSTEMDVCSFSFVCDMALAKYTRTAAAVSAAEDQRCATKLKFNSTLATLRARGASYDQLPREWGSRDTRLYQEKLRRLDKVNDAYREFSTAAAENTAAWNNLSQALQMKQADLAAAGGKDPPPGTLASVLRWFVLRVLTLPTSGKAHLSVERHQPGKKEVANFSHRHDSYCSQAPSESTSKGQRFAASCRASRDHFVPALRRAFSLDGAMDVEFLQRQH
ncbi:hypothetical protein FI667_g5201, partial [Globisporangium splendens]